MLFILLLGQELADSGHWKSEITLTLRLRYTTCCLFIQEQESDIFRLLSGAEACRGAKRHNPGKNWRRPRTRTAATRSHEAAAYSRQIGYVCDYFLFNLAR